MDFDNDFFYNFQCFKCRNTSKVSLDIDPRSFKRTFVFCGNCDRECPISSTRCHPDLFRCEHCDQGSRINANTDMSFETEIIVDCENCGETSKIELADEA
jgi:hypothetical protein